MVQQWWAAGFAVPALLLARAGSGKGKPKKEIDDIDSR